MTAEISIIMRTKDSAETVDQVLKSLFSQRNQSFRLYVVDSGSTDTTLDIVQQYPAEIRKISPEEYFPAQVLNHAIEACSTEVIVFLNSDTVLLHPHCLDNLLAPLDNPSVCATFGRQIARPDAEPWVQRDYEYAFPAQGETPSCIPYSLPFAAMRRSAWKQHPFYADAWGSEDTEWGVWATQQQHAPVYVTQATCMHSHNYSFKQLYGRRFIEGEADAFIYQRSLSFYQSIQRWISSSARDFLYYVARGHLLSIWKIPLRRAVDGFAYRHGHQWGTQRRTQANSDRKVGQKAVLSSR